MAEHARLETPPQTPLSHPAHHEPASPWRWRDPAGAQLVQAQPYPWVRDSAALPRRPQGTSRVRLHAHRARTKASVSATMLAEELRSRVPRDNSRHPLKIGILGHVGNGNLGDEAIVAS